ncbi:MAG: hypothetical protein QW745_09485 [Thermoplasmata archaeon]
MRTTKYSYFWNGMKYSDLSIPPYIYSPFSEIQWIPSISWNEIRAEQLFTSKEYVEELTQHGKVIYSPYGCHIKYIWDKDENKLTFETSTKFFSGWEANRILKDIKYLSFNMRNFSYNDNKIISFRGYKEKIGKKNVIKIEIDSQKHWISTYLLETLTIDLNDLENNRERFVELNRKFQQIQGKYSHRFFSMISKSKYSLQDILNLGNIEIQELDEYQISFFRTKPYTLVIPDSKKRKQKIIVKDMAYDLSGNVIFKILNIDYDLKDAYRIVDVALLGKEGNNWWIHYLPPFYWNASIASCERWLLNIGKNDEIIKEV